MEEKKEPPERTAMQDALDGLWILYFLERRMHMNTPSQPFARNCDVQTACMRMANHIVSCHYSSGYAAELGEAKQLIQEMSELTTALCHAYLADNRQESQEELLGKVVEELSHVMMSIGCFRIGAGISDDELLMEINKKLTKHDLMAVPIVQSPASERRRQIVRVTLECDVDDEKQLDTAIRAGLGYAFGESDPAKE